MATFRQQLKHGRCFWGEVVRMWREQHGLNLSLIWKLSPWATIFGFIGALALPEPWSYVAWIIFGLSAFILVFSLCLVFPYMKWKKDMEKVSPLVKLKEFQEGEIINNPQSLLPIIVKDLILRITEPDGVLDVGFRIFNGTVFDLELSVQAKQIKCEAIHNVDYSSTHFKVPHVSNPITELKAGRNSDQLRIEQDLPQSIISELRSSVLRKRVKWSFHLLVTLKCNGLTKEEGYYLIWDGVHTRIYP